MCGEGSQVPLAWTTSNKDEWRGLERRVRLQPNESLLSFLFFFLRSKSEQPDLYECKALVYVTERVAGFC